jgi:hypothetical protein
MKDQILELLPEINEIKDQSLRDKTVAVWADAIKRTGWTMDELKKIPFTLLAGDIDITYIEHVRTVARMCAACAEIMLDAYGPRVSHKLNRDTTIAGALLADVGKLFEYAKKDGKVVKSRSGFYLRHPFSGVALCWEHGIPEEVMHCVAVHSKEGDHVQRTAEALIVHHADFIDFDIVKYKP